MLKPSIINKSLIYFLLAGLASVACAENIFPPKDATSKTVNRDVWSCLNTAMRIASGDGEVLKGLDKELLQGHSTVGHLYELSLGDPHPIQPRADGVLAPRESLFNVLGSTKRTDPYVVCLLLKDYRWESSEETGLEMLQRLADQGNVRAQAELGRTYYFGFGVAHNNSLAFKMLSAAAKANDPDGQFYLAMLYSEGDGVLPNDGISVQWLKRAADSGHIQAQRALPQVENVAENRKKESAEAALKLATIRTAADSGNLESQRTLANYYIEGIGVTQDASTAIEWYKKAAQSGDAAAARQIGVLYDKGRGVSVDYVEAVKWYKVAAEKGDSQAQYNLGVLMYYGVGVELNEEQGKDWIRRSAEQNNQLAIKALQSFK
jgi:TPR repeat protein